MKPRRKSKISARKISKKSRFHVYRTSPTKTLLISDSQAREFDAGNLNVISLPGASVRHVYKILPPKGRFDVIILFIGGNDLYNWTEPSTIPAESVSKQIEEVANALCSRAKQVYVIGIPERDQNKTRSREVNDALQATANRSNKSQSPVKWKFRSVVNYLTGARYFSPRDLIHLNRDGLNNLRNLIKAKILYKSYSKELNLRGNEALYTCQTNNCRCPCRYWCW